MPEKIYSESPELRSIAEKLKERYFLHLGHIDLSTIYFAEIVSEKPKKAKLGEISGISSVWVKQRMQEDSRTPHLFCLAVYATEWEEIGPSSREWIIFDALLSINPEKVGKLRKPDIQEHGIVLQYFASVGISPYWRTSEVSLPSLTNGVPLPLPVPEDPDDTSDSTNEDEGEE